LLPRNAAQMAVGQFVRPSVSPSVFDVELSWIRGHVGWNTYKIL